MAIVGGAWARVTFGISFRVGKPLWPLATERGVSVGIAAATDQPNVKQKSSAPGSRNSISKVRSAIGAGWRMSW